MYEVDAETQYVVISLALVPHEEVPRDVVSDAVQNLWELSVRQQLLDSKGWIEEMQGPVFDSSAIISVQYESIKDFLEHHEADEIIFGEAFKVELEDSMDRYFKQKLLLIIHGDLEDHMFITKSPVAETELVATEKRMYKVELQDF